VDPFLASSGARRRELCEQAAGRLGLQAASIEKDYWICWVLRGLFDLPEIGPQLTFKGGTSLSKAWKLIERFSEDIDLVIDRRRARSSQAGTSVQS
jgi:predicted nucleotidyltransferase component of viral defense system